MLNEVTSYRGIPLRGPLGFDRRNLFACRNSVARRPVRFAGRSEPGPP